VGKGGTVQIPLRCEGKGKFVTGNHFILKRNVLLGIGKGSRFTTKDNLKIGANATVEFAYGSDLTAGDNLTIDRNAQIIVNGNWIWGNRVNISPGVQILSREEGHFGNLMIGNESEIGDNTILDVSSNIEIGNQVSIGPNSVLYTHNHLYQDISLAAWKGGVKTAPIIIEDGAWIASGVTILPGVTIGKHAVVASSAVVTKSLEGYAVYGGIPAKLLRKIEK